jgi:hypothetical protein
MVPVMPQRIVIPQRSEEISVFARSKMNYTNDENAVVASQLPLNRYFISD